MSEPCPDCDNPGMDDVSENDDDYDYFCHWCGGLFTEEELEEVSDE